MAKSDFTKNMDPQKYIITTSRTQKKTKMSYSLSSQTITTNPTNSERRHSVRPGSTRLGSRHGPVGPGPWPQAPGRTSSAFIIFGFEFRFHAIKRLGGLGSPGPLTPKYLKKKCQIGRRWSFFLFFLLSAFVLFLRCLQSEFGFIK